nr:glycosyltransferase [Patulibacter sp. SYSU D01012]
MPETAPAEPVAVPDAARADGPPRAGRSAAADPRAGAAPAAGGRAATDVTVVIATRGRAARLDATLTALRDASPGVAVIVCDDASADDETARVARRHDGVTLVRLRHNAGAAARNAGAREARTPLVAFCDDDSWFLPGALDRAAEHFAADPRLALLNGRILVGDDQRLDPVCDLMARSPLGRAPAGPEILGFLACAAVVRRDAFLAVGGFPRRYGIGGEEAPVAIDLAAAGWRGAYAADVLARHLPDAARHPGPRRARTTRNDLWTTWRRRPVGTALRATVGVARQARRDEHVRDGLRQAVAGLPWALATRRAPSAALESRLRDLDAQNAARSPAGLPPLPPHELRAGRPVRPGERTTVVIAARNGWHQLERTLAELAALPERPPVIVVDDASQDGTAAHVQAAHPDVTVVRLRERRGPVARNAGVRLARTPYVAFADADSWWAPGTLDAAADLFDAHPELGLVTARILVGEDGRVDPISDEMAASPLPWDPELPGHPLVSFMGGASAVRRRAFVDVGGFEERLVVGGEEELVGTELVTAGWAMRYVPELVVHHHPEGERRGEVRALGLRNALWFLWRRRPWPTALSWSAHLVRASGPRTETARGVALALRGLPWALATRRRPAPWTERGMHAIERQRRGSRARDYGAYPEVPAVLD